MAPMSVLQWTPLATAAVWLAIVGYLVVSDRYRTWTEGYFLAACASVGGYALSDFFFFNARDFGFAWVAAVASLLFISLTALFFFLYGLTLSQQRIRRRLLLAALPLALIDAFLPGRILVGLGPLDASAPPYLPVYDPAAFGIWVGMILAYAAGGLAVYYRTYRQVSRISKNLGRHMAIILASLFAVTILGGITNTALGLLDVRVFPLFSTVLILPGLLLATAVSPGGHLTFSTVMRRIRSKEYHVVAALVFYRDGTLVGSLSDPSVRVGDTDLIAAMADVIHHFMRTSFPRLLGGGLHSLEHGGYQLALERGRFVTLVVVLKGNETDFLRRQMRDLLRGYEARNRDIFARWKGLMGEDVGTPELLGAFLREPDDGAG